MHYVGTFKSNGREFDNSRKKGKALTFLVGIGQGERRGVARGRRRAKLFDVNARSALIAVQLV